MSPADSEDFVGSRKTVIAALKFADFFRSDGRCKQAEELQRRVISQTDPSSPEHRLALRQLATNLRTRGDYHAAAAIQEEAVERLVKGTEDMDGAFELLELARTYQYQAHLPPPPDRDNCTPPGLAQHEQHWQAEQYQLMSKAVDLATRGLAAVCKYKGDDSLAAASAMGILGEVAYHNKDYAQARSVEEKALDIRVLRLGPKNHFTLQAKDDLAIGLAKQGEYATAARMHEEVQQIRLATLGEMHPSTLETERMLARAWRMAGSAGVSGRRRPLQSSDERPSGPLEKSTGTPDAANALWRCLVEQSLLDKAEALRGEYGLLLNSAEVEMLREARTSVGELHVRFGDKGTDTDTDADADADTSTITSTSSSRGGREVGCYPMTTTCNGNTNEEY
ncbi:hypothetical protein V8F06_013899 [Rhypophila decipiens]